jgi:hypothetical protein
MPTADCNLQTVFVGCNEGWFEAGWTALHARY